MVLITLLYVFHGHMGSGSHFIIIILLFFITSSYNIGTFSHTITYLLRFFFSFIFISFPNYHENVIMKLTREPYEMIETIL